MTGGVVNVTSHGEQADGPGSAGVNGLSMPRWPHRPKGRGQGFGVMRTARVPTGDTSEGSNTPKGGSEQGRSGTLSSGEDVHQGTL